MNTSEKFLNEEPRDFLDTTIKFLSQLAGAGHFPERLKYEPPLPLLLPRGMWGPSEDGDWGRVDDYDYYD